jgi:tRNA (cytidine/uridine-2'-O-)-methyltransferase
MNIVLLEPEIPQNAGNIGRTCAAAKAKLHFIRPMAFFIDEKSVKRAGLDYWSYLEHEIYDDYDDFLKKNNFPKVIMATTKAKKTYAEYDYAAGDYIMFGKESAGIPETLLAQNYKNCVRIPMRGESRSLNLANSVAIILYEALRQLDFEGLERDGNL